MFRKKFELGDIVLCHNEYVGVVSAKAGSNVRIIMSKDCKAAWVSSKYCIRLDEYPNIKDSDKNVGKSLDWLRDIKELSEEIKKYGMVKIIEHW